MMPEMGIGRPRSAAMLWMAPWPTPAAKKNPQARTALPPGMPHGFSSATAGNRRWNGCAQACPPALPAASGSGNSEGVGAEGSMGSNSTAHHARSNTQEPTASTYAAASLNMTAQT